MKRLWWITLALAAAASMLAEDVPLTNWTVPSRSGSSSGSRFNVSTNGDVRDPSVFIPITPCRVVDTRGAVGAFGGPSYASNETRTYDIDAGPCTGIPNAAAAFSLNFTVVNYNTSVGGFVTAYQAGTSRPFVSTVNYGTGPAVANAAIVPASGFGSISVYAFGTTHIIIDINGYYADWLPDLTPGRHLSMWGTYSFGGVVQGSNYSTTSGLPTSGVYGRMISAVAETAGVSGTVPAGATNYGVSGRTDTTSINAAGVYGIAPAPMTVHDSIISPVAGVRGESSTSNGVIGLTELVNYFGVTGVNINPNPVSVRSEGVLGYGAYAVYAFGDTGATGVKNFVDPHPTDPTQVIRYASIEGREVATFFRGKGRFSQGRATITVPEDFRMVTESEGITVQVTPVGGFAMTAVQTVSLDGIEVAATEDVDFTFLVIGVRKGYAGFQPISTGQQYQPRSHLSTMPDYLTDNQKASLVSNGTYNADGTVNLDTALRLGWDKIWARSRMENR